MNAVMKKKRKGKAKLSVVSGPKGPMPQIGSDQPLPPEPLKAAVQAALAPAPQPSEPQLLKLDIGCGPKPLEGFVGVDIIKFNENVTQWDLADRSKPWPYADNSVGAVNCSHFLEHLTNLNDKWERVYFFNELWRVMSPGAKANLVIPHWCSERYYGDPTHKEPFSEFGFYYLDPNWREPNAPHTDFRWNLNGYKCHFGCYWGYNYNPEWAPRNEEAKQFASRNYKGAITDIVWLMECVKKQENS